MLEYILFFAMTLPIPQDLTGTGNRKWNRESETVKIKFKLCANETAIRK
jgi:hypothetical protein